MNSSKLQEIYDKRFQFFLDGYEIVELEADDCDAYGIMYWALCKNGVGAREWNINHLKKEGIKEYKKEVVENSIRVMGTTYYVNPEKYYFGNSIIEIISEEDFLKMWSDKDILQNILDRYMKFLSDENTKKKKFENSLKNNSTWYKKSMKVYDIKSGIKKSILTSGPMMLRSLGYNLAYSDYKKLLEDFKTEIDLTKDERIMLNL